MIATHRKSVRPLIEPLESRIAPAVTANLVSGVLTITLGAGTDSASISTMTLGNTINVSGTGLASTQFTSVSSIQLNYDAAGSQSVGVTDTVAFALPGGFHVNTSSSSITGASFSDSTGGNAFDFSGFTGVGTFSNSVGSDTIAATKSASFTLTNTTLSATDGMSLGISGVGTANLTDTGGGHSFTVSGWSGGGTLTGLSTDTVIANKTGGFTLSNTSLMDSADVMSLTLSGIGLADLTNSGSSSTFNITGWTGGGTLAGSGTDTIQSSVAGGFTLTNTSLAGSVDALNVTLSGFTVANLADSLGGSSFTVSGWTHGGTLTNSGGSADTIVAIKSASYTLTNTSLSSTDDMSLTLSGSFATANLTDTGGSHSFTVTGWSGGGTLTGAATDTVIASKSGNFILTNTSLSDSGDLMNLSLSGVGIANLTDTGSSHSFTVTGWSGGGTLMGAATDTVVASKNGNFILTNTSLSDSGDSMSLTLSGIGIADLTDAAGTHGFTVTGWSGSGVLSGGLSDTVIASKNGSFVLTNTSLSDTGDGMSLTLSGIGIANLTDTGSGHSFTVSGWGGDGTLTGAATDTVIASKNGSFTLTNTSLADTADSMNLTLSGIGIANLTDGGSSDSFTVSGWSGTGTLMGPSSDTVIASKDGNFTLTNTSLTDTGDGMSLTLSGLGIANLTDTGGSHGFTVSGWSGGGTLTGLATDTVVASKNGNFTLTNTSLSDTGDGMSLTLSGIVIADLTDSGSSHSFTVSGWTGGGILTGAATDTVIATKNAGFILTNTSLSSTDNMAVTLAGGIGLADLTDTGGSHDITVTGWSGGGILSGALSDTVIATKNGGFTLTNTSLSDTADGMSLTLSGIGIAALTDTAGGHSFIVSGWTGSGSLDDSGGSTDTVTASKNASFTLTNSSLSSTDGMDMTLSGITIADLTDTGGSHSFTVSGWTGSGIMTGTGTDSVIASKNASFTLTNTSLTSTDGMSLTLSGITIADLTDTGSSHSFTVSGWTGSGALTGAASDTVIASKSASFTLTNTSLSSTDGMSLNLSGITIADLTDTGSGHSITVTGWTGTGIFTGTATDTIMASANASFTLTNTSLTSTTGMDLTLSGITIADLTDTGGSHSFTVSGWTGTGVLTGTPTDTVIATKSASYTLTNTSLTSSDGMSLTLSNITVADLTDTGSSHTFTVTGWSGGGALTGAASDTVIASKAGSFTLTNNSLSDTGDLMSLTLSGIGIAQLTDTGAGNTFTVSGWTGSGSLTDSGGTTDEVAASKNASFTLTNSSLTSTDGMSLTLSGITVADLTDTGSGNSFTVSGWTGTGTLAGAASDTVISSKNASYTLANGELSSTDGMNLEILTGIRIADIGCLPGGNSINVSGWTGTGTLIGGLNDSVIASKSASYTLTNTSLTSTDGMSLTLSGFTIADLTDTGGSHSFTVTGWSGTGTLTGLSTDTVIASKNGNFTLTNTSVSDAGDSMNLALSSIGFADLTDTGGSHSFTVSGWTGGGTLTGLATDTVIASKNGNFVLTNTSLSDTGDSMNLTLSSIGFADLTDTGGSHSFTVSGWTGGGILTGLATDTVIASKSASYTLTNTSLTSTDGMSLTLTGPAIADLTDTGGSNSFTVTGWSGTGTLTGLVTDTVIASKAGGFTLTNTSLVDSADSMNLTLSGIGIADLTDTAGGNLFTVSGWTGSGTLTNSGGSADTVTAIKDASFTLTDTALSATDDMSLTLSPNGGFTTANLTDTGGSNSFTVSGWTHGGTLTGLSTDTVIATKAGGFTLTNTSLIDTVDSMSLTLVSIGNAQLTDTAGNNTFTVSGWTGGGSLTNSGGTTDTVVAVKTAADFTLTNSNLTTSDGLDMAISGIAKATLTGTGAATFTFGTGTGVGANDWTGLATILADGGAPGEGTVNVVKSLADQAGNDYAYVLTDTGVTSNDGLGSNSDVIVAFNGAGATHNFMTANLTDNVAGGTFDINTWTYGFGAAGESVSYDTSGTLTGAIGGGDTVLRQVASVSGEIKLTDAAIMSSNTASSLGDMAMQLVNFNASTSKAIVGEGTATVIGKPLAGWMINAAGFGTASVVMTGSASLRNLFVADAGADTINGGKQVNTYVLTTGSDVADTITSQSVYNLLDYENATSGVNVNLGDGAGQIQDLDGTDTNSGTLALTGSYRYFIGSQASDIIHASTNKRVTVDGKSINDETVEIYGGPGGAGVVDHIFKGVGSTHIYGPLVGSGVIGNSTTAASKPTQVFEGLFDSNGLPGTGIAGSPTKVDKVFLSYLYNANTQIYNTLEYQAYNSTGTRISGRPVEPDTATWIPFVDLVGAGDATPV